MAQAQAMTASGIIVVRPSDCETFVGPSRLTKILIDRRVGVSGASVSWITMPPGSRTEQHAKESQTEIAFVISGRLTLTTPSGSVTLEAGDAGAIPPKTPHVHSNEGPDWNRFLIVHTPDGPEQDFRRRHVLEQTQLPE